MTAQSGCLDQVAGRDPSRPAPLRGAEGVLAMWSERHRRRAELKELLDVPEYLLKDMGITREEVYREYCKPFWRA